MASRWLAEHAASWACLLGSLRNSHGSAFLPIIGDGSRIASIPRSQACWRTLVPEKLFTALDPSSSSCIVMCPITRWRFRASQRLDFSELLALKMLVTVVVRRSLAQERASHDLIRWMILLLLVSAFTGPESECIIHSDAIRRLAAKERPLKTSFELKCGQVQIELTPTHFTFCVEFSGFGIHAGYSSDGDLTDDDSDDDFDDVQLDNEDRDEAGDKEENEDEWLNP